MKKDLLIKLLERIRMEESLIALKKWFPSFNGRQAIEKLVHLNSFQVSKLLKIEDKRSFLLYLYKCVDAKELNSETYNFLLTINTENINEWIILIRFLGEENARILVYNIKKFIKSKAFVKAIENLVFNDEIFALQDLVLLKNCNYNICEVCNLISYSKDEENLLNYYPSLITLVGSSCNINVLKVYNLIMNGYLFCANIHPLVLANTILNLEPEKASILEEIMKYDNCRRYLNVYVDALIDLDLNILYKEEFEFDKTILSDRFRMYVRSQKLVCLKEEKSTLNLAIKKGNIDKVIEFFDTKNEEKNINFNNVVDLNARRKR